jgi:hypothetical protein
MTDKFIPPNCKPAFGTVDVNSDNKEWIKCMVIECFNDSVWVLWIDYDSPLTYDINKIEFKPCLDGA